jgi:phosphatidylglycerophosphatase C
VVDPDPPREPAPWLVVFDLDGTLTRRDTLTGYAFGLLARHPTRWWRILGVVPALLRFTIGKADHGELKGALLHCALGGLSREHLAAWTACYVPRLIRGGMFAEGLAEVSRHREAGHHLVLMSATVDLYVPAIAEGLGFDEWVCSRVRWHGDRLDGRLDGPNIRDREKARCLRTLIARFPRRRIMGYGNSRPDLAHLRLVDKAVLVNAGVRLRQAAADLPVDFKTWI